MNSQKKIIGWVLLVLGLIIIFWTIFSSYNIFTAKKPAPAVFKAKEQEKKEDVSQKDYFQNFSQEELQKELQWVITEQIKEILPSDFLVKLMNLISWSIFAGILFFGGAKISGIGINLLK